MHLGRNLADRAFDLGVAGVADQDDLAALGGVAAALVVHLGDQRAGRVDHRQVALGGQLLDPLGHAVGGEDRHRAGRDLVQFVDEHRAAGAQILHHVPVVHDFVTDIDRRAEFLQRPLDDFDRPLHAGAETAGLGQDDADHGQFSPVDSAYGMLHPERQWPARAASGRRGLDSGCGNANGESRPFGNTGGDSHNHKGASIPIWSDRDRLGCFGEWHRKAALMSAVEMDLPAAMARVAEVVEAALEALLPPVEGAEARLAEAMRYATLGGGKRMRAFLVMESAALFAVSQTCAARVAASVEMLHAYSLVHDDLPAMDDDDLRRGKPIHAQGVRRGDRDPGGRCAADARVRGAGGTGYPFRPAGALRTGGRHWARRRVPAAWPAAR